MNDQNLRSHRLQLFLSGFARLTKKAFLWRLLKLSNSQIPPSRAGGSVKKIRSAKRKTSKLGGASAARRAQKRPQTPGAKRRSTARWHTLAGVEITGVIAGTTTAVRIGAAQTCRRIAYERVRAAATTGGVDNARAAGAACGVGVADLAGRAAAAACRVADALATGAVAEVAVADLARRCAAAVAAGVADADARIHVASLTWAAAAATRRIGGAQARGGIADFAGDGSTRSGATIGIGLPLTVLRIVAGGSCAR